MSIEANGEASAFDEERLAQRGKVIVRFPHHLRASGCLFEIHYGSVKGDHVRTR
jgi:hypothetical protein